MTDFLSPLWQGLLDGLGWIIARIYSVVPSYGVTIIVLTILIRVVLLPLGLKQIQSMHRMQALQPKVKSIQQKYKGNKQRIQEETMKLYQEMGVNPLSGCWPLLVQFPILIAMYHVLRQPQYPPHLPTDSPLYEQINEQLTDDSQRVIGTDFLGMNLLCTPAQAGRPAEVVDTKGDDRPGNDVKVAINCGESIPVRIPYYAIALLMFGTTYYQQRQMQKASPPGASQQQQVLLKVMPLMFGVFGFFFPAGLVVYWTVSNLWQIGQQHFVLKAREKATSEPQQPKRPARKGFMSRMADQAQEGRKRREQASGRGSGGARGNPGGSKRNPPTKGPGARGSGGKGGTGGGTRKKRPKR